MEGSWSCRRLCSRRGDRGQHTWRLSRKARLFFERYKAMGRAASRFIDALSLLVYRYYCTVSIIYLGLSFTVCLPCVIHTPRDRAEMSCALGSPCLSIERRGLARSFSSRARQPRPRTLDSRERHERDPVVEVCHRQLDISTYVHRTLHASVHHPTSHLRPSASQRP